MSFHSKTETLPELTKDGVFNRIIAKYKETKNEDFLRIAINHLTVYEKYLKMVDEKGPAAFPNRLEYQKFAVAKLFIDKVHLLEFKLNPSVKGYKEYKDERLPPLDAFNMTEDLIETRKIKFLRNIEKGDVLNLRVVEASDKEFKLLVINKYDENERVVDYNIYAYMMNGYLLEKLPRPMKVNDFVRAAVLGKLKMEEKGFSKLLVTLNDNWVNDKYKGIQLVLVVHTEIPFYPEDISGHSCFIDYMKTVKHSDDLQEMVACMDSVGIDPYKIYSFRESCDGKKLGKPKEIDNSAMEIKMMDRSMELVKEAEKLFLQSEDIERVLSIFNQALEIYPQNDAAYALRAQLWWTRFYLNYQSPEFINRFLLDCEKAIEINTYNLTATRVYLTVLLLSAETFKEEGNNEKANEIMQILLRCKKVCDVIELLGKLDDDKSKQSPTEESQSGPIPMD